MGSVEFPIFTCRGCRNNEALLTKAAKAKGPEVVGAREVGSF